MEGVTLAGAALATTDPGDGQCDPYVSALLK